MIGTRAQGHSLPLAHTHKCTQESNKLKKTHSLLLLITMLFASHAAADDDPCNFNDGSAAFGWQRVMDCYNSVPFNHDDLVNAVEFITAGRERGDQREIFEERIGWRQSTAALDNPDTLEDYPSDFAMQMAIVGNHKEFLNPHWRYRRPWCYTMFLGAFMPFDFGSDLERVKNGKPQQVYFIEGAPFLPDLYEAFTGIDARQYIGMKIISINGEEPGEYFRQWGRNVFRMDENDGVHLNGVLQYGEYSVRIYVTHDVPPATASDTYVLESANGQQVEVVMPWIFAPRGTFGADQFPLAWSNSTAEFDAVCQAPSDTQILVNNPPFGILDEAQAKLRASGVQAGELEFAREIMEKRDAVAGLKRANGGAGYFEKPHGQMDQQLEIIVPWSDGAEVKQMGKRATFIHLDHFVGDWKDEVIAGTNHACENSDRLVLDMRGNGGGRIDQIEWLVTHLFPDRTMPAEYSTPGRMLASSVGRNELSVRLTDFFTDFWGLPGVCIHGYEAACWVDIFSGEVLTDKFWMSNNTVNELRGGQLETLTQWAGFRNSSQAYAAGADPIACPGKFEDDTLVILSNGTGASAGHFFPELIRDQAVMVTAGGYVGEPLVSGIARGGAVWPMEAADTWPEQYLQFVYGPVADPMPYPVRSIETFVEQPALYKTGLGGLYVNEAPVGDIHVDVWASSPGSDAYVYGKVLNAVQKNSKK